MILRREQIKMKNINNDLIVVIMRRVGWLLFFAMPPQAAARYY